MDFRSVNPLNIRLNLLSGNLLPVTVCDSPFPLPWKIYSVIVWMIELTVAIVIIPGCMYVSTEKILKDGLICFAVSSEMLFMILRLHTYKDLIHQLIQQLNDILHSRDEAVRNIVMATLKPVEIPLNIYWRVGVISIITWGSVPYVLIFEKNVFYYEDYKIPATFSRQPFSLLTFVLGNLFLTISAVYMFLKKVGVDVYMVHLVLLTTSQYRYIAGKIATIFQKKYEHDANQNRKKERELKDLCRHHNAVVHLTLLLKRLLSLNFSLIYINSVFRFSAISIMVITAPTLWERILTIVYASGSVIQLYILCSCVQQLLDASTEMTDKAFHEDWYVLKRSIKSMFSLIIMANNLECKLATFENFNLSLSSFMTILNQAYTIALLFLRIK